MCKLTKLQGDNLSEIWQSALKFMKKISALSENLTYQMKMLE